MAPPSLKPTTDFGPIRSLPAIKPTLFLTFDDGPDPRGTSAVLEILARHQASASFFLVGTRARKQPDIVRRIIESGHAIGNHSLDHRYRNYFRGSESLQTWIEECETILRDLTGSPSVGFRPPAGIRTPALHRAVTRLKMPMILWNTRFYDAINPWGETKARKSLESVGNGDIILLHDRQREKNSAVFLKTLDFYVGEALQRGYRLERLPIRSAPLTDHD